MLKRETVELESAFLTFIQKAESLGFVFPYDTETIHLQHNSETTHDMNGAMTLQVRDFRLSNNIPSEKLRF